MKKIYILIFFMFPFSLCLGQQQNYSLQKYPSRFRFSFDNIQTKLTLADGTQEPNMGFLGHGYEVFGLYPQIPEAYFGFTTFSAITGIRSGFIVFGVSGGYQNHLTEKLYYDIGLFAGGGGGSGAPDGGGLMIKPHLDFSYQIHKTLALRTGLSYVTFPSGDIRSLHLNVGFTLNTNTYIADITKDLTPNSSSPTFKHVDMGLLSSNLFGFQKGPLKNNAFSEDPNVIPLLGVIVKTRQLNHLYGIVKAGGAFVGSVDGFMFLAPGLGYQIPLNSWLSVNGQGYIGGAGGGNVDFGGGLAIQLEGGLDLKLGDYILGFNIGKTYAPNGNFESNHLDLSLNKSFYLTTLETEKTFDSKDLELASFQFSVGNRLYLVPDGIGKFGEPYDDFFNLINFEIEKKFHPKISLVLATNWAYQGSYGAYAEGWIGMQYYWKYQPEKWNVTSKAFIGAAGGGGIDLGGLGFQYSVGTEKKLNKRWRFTANIGQVRPAISGNFTPTFMDVGFKLNLNQLVKK